MGQYYYPTNVNKMEYLYSHNFNNGLKLMEHSYIENDFMNVVERLLSPKGSWHKNSIVWAGDYMDEGIFVPVDAPKSEDGNTFNLHSYVKQYGKNALVGADELNPDEQTYEEREKLSAKLTEKFSKTLPKKGRYLVNHTKRVCLDLQAEKGNEETWRDNTPIVIHPLSLLTCSGNGRGGGDYKGSNMGIIGCWAGDIISMEYDIMYTLNKPINFKEGGGRRGNYKFNSLND